MAARDLSDAAGADAAWSEYAGARGDQRLALGLALDHRVLAVHGSGRCWPRSTLGFTEYSIANPPKWVGTANYEARALRQRPALLAVAGPDASCAAFVMVPIGLAGSLLIAVLLNQRLRAPSLFRTLFFLPQPGADRGLGGALAWLYHPDFGGINDLLVAGRHRGAALAVDPRSAHAVADGHRALGHHRRQHHDHLPGRPPGRPAGAARGGRDRRRRRLGSGSAHITLPLLTPTIFFNLVIGVIAALKVFAVGVRRHQGRPELRHLVLHPAPVPDRLPELRDGLRLGAGLDLLRDRRRR